MEFVIGMLVGALLFYLFVDHKKVSGAFIIDLSDAMEDKPFRLELYDDLNAIYSKKSILFKVNRVTESSPK